MTKVSGGTTVSGEGRSIDCCEGSDDCVHTTYSYSRRGARVSWVCPALDARVRGLIIERSFPDALSRSKMLSTYMSLPPRPAGLAELSNARFTGEDQERTRLVSLWGTL